MNSKAFAFPASQRGQATIEYAVVLVVVVLVLIAKPDVIQELIDSIKQIYTAFAYAISASDILLG